MDHPLKEKLQEFQDYLGDRDVEIEERFGCQEDVAFGYRTALVDIQAKWEQLDVAVPRQVNLSLDEDQIEMLKAVLEREELALAQRPLTGYIGLRRKPRGLIVAEGVPLCSLTPEEAILLGIQLFGMGGLRAPEFLEQFGLKIEAGTGVTA